MAWVPPGQGGAYGAPQAGPSSYRHPGYPSGAPHMQPPGQQYQQYGQEHQQYGQYGQTPQQHYGQAQHQYGYHQHHNNNQQHQQHAMPPPPVPSSSSKTSLKVTGCSKETVSRIIRGTFTEIGENHSKPLYKKDGETTGQSVVQIYFWDDRDGPNFAGWWFGPKVGGDQVWAYNSNKTSPYPPETGWQVPWDGPEDPSLRLTWTPSSASSGPSNNNNSNNGYGAGNQGGHHNNAWSQPGSGGAYGSRAGPSSSNYNREDDRDREQRERERRRRQEEERKRQDEEREREREREREERRRRQQEEEERKKRREEEDRKREEARRERRRREAEEEETRRRESAAVSQVRKVIQQIRTVSTQDALNELQLQLEAAQAEQKEAMGSQAERVQQEGQRVTAEALARLEEQEKARQERERRLEQEREHVEGLREKIVAEAQEAESKAKDVKALVAETLKPGLSLEELADATAIVCEAVKSAKKSLEEIGLSMREKWVEMGESEASQSVTVQVRELVNEVGQSKRDMEKLREDTETRLQKATRKSKAEKTVSDRIEAFKKFDEDGDGLLSKEEVVSFAIREFDFELPALVSDKIMKSLAPIDLAKFRSLFQKVGIAKHEARARELREQLERQKKELEEKRIVITNLAQEATSLLKDAEVGVKRTEQDAQTLLDGISHRKSDETLDLAATLEKLSEASQAVLDQSAEKIKLLEEGNASAVPELQGFISKLIAGLQPLQSTLQDRTDKVTGHLATARQGAAKQAYRELDELSNTVATAIRSKLSEDGTSLDALIAQLVPEDSVDAEKFVDLVSGLKTVSVSKEQAKNVLEHIAGGSEKVVSKDRFVEYTRLYYKCVKGTPMSEESDIKSKSLRRLEVGEVCELLEGPIQEEEIGVQRVKCKAMLDGTCGWVTTAGNQGTVFLVPGGNLYTCVKELDMLSTSDKESATLVRKVEKGEVVQVLEFSSASMETKRIRGRAKLDGVEGWMTVMDQGELFLEQQ